MKRQLVVTVIIGDTPHSLLSKEMEHDDTMMLESMLQEGSSMVDVQVSWLGKELGISREMPKG